MMIKPSFVSSRLKSKKPSPAKAANTQSTNHIRLAPQNIKASVPVFKVFVLSFLNQNAELTRAAMKVSIKHIANSTFE